MGTSIIVQNRVAQNRDDACIFAINFTLTEKTKNAAYIEVERT